MLSKKIRIVSGVKLSGEILTFIGDTPYEGVDRGGVLRRILVFFTSRRAVFFLLTPALGVAGLLKATSSDVSSDITGVAAGM
jgi:hypothetical protein